MYYGKVSHIDIVKLQTLSQPYTTKTWDWEDKPVMKQGGIGGVKADVLYKGKVYTFTLKMTDLPIKLSNGRTIDYPVPDGRPY